VSKPATEYAVARGVSLPLERTDAKSGPGPSGNNEYVSADILNAPVDDLDRRVRFAL
jgi:hypothetical protein